MLAHNYGTGKFFSHSERWNGRVNPMDEASVDRPPGYIAPADYTHGLKESSAPFSSTSRRGGLFASQDEDDSFGKYDVRSSLLKDDLLRDSVTSRKIAPFTSTTERFQVSTADCMFVGPGPAGYALKTHMGDGLYAEGRTMGKSTRRRKPAAITAPSVPIPKQAYGYVEEVSGKLRKVQPVEVPPAGNKEDSIGPDAYSVSLSTLKRRAAGGAFSRSPRGMRAGKFVTPAPNTYSLPSLVGDPKKWQNVGPQFLDRVDRFQAEVHPAPGSPTHSTERSPRSPGPHAYNTSRGFEKGSVARKDFQFFGSTEPRFRTGALKKRADPKPGPGTYVIPSSLSHSATDFMHATSRKSLINEEGSVHGPGPAGYDPSSTRGFFGGKAKKLNSSYSVFSNHGAGTFNTTSRRFPWDKSDYDEMRKTENHGMVRTEYSTEGSTILADKANKPRKLAKGAFGSSMGTTTGTTTGGSASEFDNSKSVGDWGSVTR